MTDITQLLNSSKHFCVLPWVHFHSWPNGNVMPCCIADSDKPVAKINKDESIIQMMNSEDFKRIRKSMLADEPSAECKRCYDLELLNTWTMRQSHNRRRGHDYIDAIESTNEDGSIDEFHMHYMDIRFSNLCNMKCRSCGPGCSSLWAEEHARQNGATDLKKHFGINSIVVNSNEDQMFMAKLTPYLKDVTEVYFAGGEVIITPEHYECLDYWIDNNLTNQVELTYTTNFSVLKYKDKDLLEYWKKFPNLKVWASLDAGNDQAELIRKGSDWKKIVRNIRLLKSQVPHVQFQITPTISIWNIFTFADFFDELVDQCLIIMDKVTEPRFNLLTNPWWANTMILPNHMKEQLIDRYTRSVRRFENNHTLSNSFKMIIHNLKMGSENIDGLKEFVKYNNNIDNIRNENILETIPELTELYKWINEN